MTYLDDISSSLVTRLSEGLARIAAVSRQLDWQTSEAEGLSPTQADILRFIASRPKGVRLAAAAAHAGVRSATASDAVSTLVRKALILKHADITDGRAVTLIVTPRGRQCAQDWPESFIPVVNNLDAAEQETLLRLVTKMIRQLQTQNLIAPQRTCVACRFFKENAAPDKDEPHYCNFIGAPMADRHLRIDCAEYEPIAA